MGKLRAVAFPHPMIQAHSINNYHFQTIFHIADYIILTKLHLQIDIVQFPDKILIKEMVQSFLRC